PGATVDVRRVLDEHGQAESWTVANEIVRFGSSGLDVLNLSFVCYTEDGQPPLVLATAVDRLPSELVVVAAAGNHGDVADEQQRGRVTGRAAFQDIQRSLDHEGTSRSRTSTRRPHAYLKLRTL